MFQSKIITLVAFLSLGLFIQVSVGLQVTSPSQYATLNLKGKNWVTWTSVSTDPKTFNVVLVNQNPNCAPTGMSRVIKENVWTSAGKLQIKKIWGVKALGGYQINLVDTNNHGILAQSGQFTVL